MKNIFSPAHCRFVILMLACSIFSGTVFAKKIYPSKGGDNSIYINGPYYNYAPGDTFVLRASGGPYNIVEFYNVYGTSAAPVVLINEGGQVNVSHIRLKNSRYMKVRGVGSASHNYGFYMTSPNYYQPAVDINGRSSNIEVSNIDINIMGYGFFIKQEAACEDSLQAPNWVMDNISVHDTRMTNLNQEGFYIGSTAPNAERSIVCNGVTKYPLTPRLGNIRIYNNIIDRTGRGGIQLSSAPFGNNEVYNNTISNCGLELNEWQGNGIVLGAYTAAYVHDNNINNTLTSGIFSLGAGLVRIENNTINNSGSLSGKTVNYSSSIYIDTRKTDPAIPLQFIIKNNNLGTCTGGYHVRAYKGLYPVSSNNIVCNNSTPTGGQAVIYVEPGLAYAGCSANQLPVVNAGPAQTISLPVASVNLNGSATDADGTIASYQWSQVSGPAPAIIASVSSAATVVSALVAGTYTFKLTATDNSGAAGSSTVTITVNATAAPPAGSSIKIEAESFTAMNGIQTEAVHDLGGGMNVGWQDNNDWMDYSVNIATAGTYTVNFRVASFFTGAQFQVRKADGTILQTVTVPNTGSFQTWQTINSTITLPAGQQTLRLFTNAANGGWNINWWEIMTTASTTTPGTNQAPVANAGADQTITLPASSASLAGNGTDADGSISTYTWTMVSGPAAVSFSNAASANTTVSGLVQGSYTLKLTVKDNAGATASDEIVLTVSAATTTTPTNTSIKIEAESFASMSGIQTEATQDAGGGLNIGWQDNNDWMDYSVNMAAAGTYTVNFRVASYFTGAQFQVKLGDGTILGTVTVPNTGSFQTWQTVPATITLPAGQQTLRLFTNAANGGWNINWWEITGAASTTADPTPPPPPPPAPTPSTQTSSIKIEAEAFTSMNGIQTEATQDAGGGLNVGWQDNNDWMDYSVNMAAAGTYTVKFRVASYFTGAQFQLRNSTGAILSTLTVPNTGSFQSWVTISASVTLPVGQQTLRLFTKAANGGWNINWWEIGTGSSGSSAATTGDAEEVQASTGSLSIFPNSVKDRFMIRMNNALTGSLKVEIRDTNGEVVKIFNLVKQNKGSLQSYLSIGDLKPGQYSLTLKMKEYTETKALTKE